MLVEGRVSKLISLELGITLNTVNTHRRNILERIGLKNTAELVRMAVEQGWV
jgi:two-component system response regulator DctR